MIHMSGAYFDQKVIDRIASAFLILDTNVLSSIASDTNYASTFFQIFGKNKYLLDPIIELEYFRGSYINEVYKIKKGIIEHKNFYKMVDHQEIYSQVMYNALKLGLVYTHNGYSDIPLGDLLITARFMIYTGEYYLLTIDKGDFSTLLFDRIAVVSIEKKVKNKIATKLEHVSILKFNSVKHKECLKILPNTIVS